MKKYPEVVVAPCILRKDGKILLVKSSRWGNYYLFPGGHVEYGETTEEAVKREAKEEIGFDVEVKKLLNYGELIDSSAYHRKAHFVFFHFWCLPKKSAGVKKDKVEITDHFWVTPQEALKLIKEKGTRQSVEKLISLLKQ